MNPLRRCPRPLTACALALMVAGAGLAAGPVAHGVLAQVSAAQAKAIWEKWKQGRAGAPDKAAPVPGEPAFWLRVASCKISTLVTQESDAEALHRFPATRPLESGGCVVFAHRDMHFRGLAGIRVRDAISIECADGTSVTYLVRKIRVLLPEQIPAALDDPENRGSLHLLTCYPFRYLGAAPQRYLVTATRRSQ